MKNKLVLIDGSSLLSTSFFGNLPRDWYTTGNTEGIMKTSSGLFTNGVYTMTKVLLNILEKQKPTHMAIAWDISRNTFRREIYPEYKAHRKETKPELGEQFGTAQRLIEALGLKNFKLEQFEADDIIGTLAKRFEDEVPVYIWTKDQDALQLVSENTRVWLNTSKAKEKYDSRNIDVKMFNLPDGVFEFTPVTFEEEYEIKPIQIIDMKAIEGDSSDNIPGVKGVGPSSVIPLLKEYGSVENIYEVIHDTDEKELADFFKHSLGIKRSPIKNLKLGEESAMLSKRLATIKTDIAVYDSLSLDELKVEFNTEGAKKIFEELEFKSLLERL